MFLIKHMVKFKYPNQWDKCYVSINLMNFFG